MRDVHELLLVAVSRAEGAGLPPTLRIALGVIAAAALIATACMFIGTRRPSD